MLKLDRRVYLVIPISYCLLKRNNELVTTHRTLNNHNKTNGDYEILIDTVTRYHNRYNVRRHQSAIKPSRNVDRTIPLNMLGPTGEAIPDLGYAEIRYFHKSTTYSGPVPFRILRGKG